MTKAVAAFTLDAFDVEDAYDVEGDVETGRAHIEKTFTGDLEATSTVEMLSVRVGGAGAGYVGVEKVRGTLEGRSGTFGILHAGTMAGEEVWGRWPLIPGSGTGELAGITGEARIEIAPDGAHTLYLDYELPAPS